MPQHKFICRGPAARTEIERAMCLKALDELNEGRNVDIWKARIRAIYAIKKMHKPNDRFGGYMDGQWRSVDEIIDEYGTEGTMRVWTMWKNERKGCGQYLDKVIKELEENYQVGTEMYRVCPKCGDSDPIVIGRTQWPE